MRYPVSFAQRRLWFLDQLSPGEATFHMPYAIWLDGPLDAAALQRAMDAMVARHPILRTAIVAVDGVPEQVVADTGSVPVEQLSLLAETQPDEPDRQAEAIALRMALQPFDLARAPLLRAALIRTGLERQLLVLVLHHIIGDGASLAVLFEELSAAYRAETGGEPAALAPLWMNYGDYAVWQRDRLQGEELERQLGYWREQLRGAPMVLTLPTDRPRPARQSFRGAIRSVHLDARTTDRLTELANGANVTMFMLFLTGFAIVLSRYSGQSDLVVGIAVGGRTHVELEPLVGLFTNTVALRVPLAGDPTFAELLGRVRDVTLAALEHQELPFEELVTEFSPERSLSHAPLVQAQFGYQSLTPALLDLPGVQAHGRAMSTRTAKLDLSMFADTEPDQRTMLSVEYSTDLFGAGWADRFLRCVVRVLEQAAVAGDTSISELSLLSAAEARSLLDERGQPARSPADQPSDVRRLLAASRSQVIDQAGSISMAELTERAARLARLLVDRGVGPEVPVGLCLDRGIGMLVGLLGVWWAGGGYVPLDPDFPPARLAAMCQGAGLRTVICDRAQRDFVGALAPDADQVWIEDPALDTGLALAPVELPDTALAYLIFTSGSTGQPKGVAIEHRAVANLLGSFSRALALGPSDRFVAVTTLSFDIALLELLLPALCGADLIIASAEQAREPDQLRDLIERTGATTMQATPQLWRLLLSAGGVPAGLGRRLCGGEALPRDLADQLAAPGAELWNVYGPTETTVWSAAGLVQPAAGPVEIGPPIEHTRLYLLDERLAPVPVGVVGEVYLAGRGLARGYAGRGRLTAAAFRPDPFSDQPGARMYRTGDRGRWLDGAGLQLLGRTDQQVKVRGFRIECGEIEAVLRAHRQVRQAAVVVADRAGEPALVGYVVPRRTPRTASTASADGPVEVDLLALLRPHLRAALPDYMMPELIVALTAMPLTPNGKVDRRALPEPDWGSRRVATEPVAPRNPVEQALAAIWSELLASPVPIGVHDNLFALGGHSLTVTRFVVRVADSYGVQLPVHQVFASPTIAELAAIVAADPGFDRAADASRHAELDALSDEDLDELLRAALAQRNRRRAVPDADS